MKGSNYLEALSNVHTVVMDKTGTLTKGVFSVQEVYPRLVTDDRNTNDVSTVSVQKQRKTLF